MLRIDYVSAERCWKAKQDSEATKRLAKAGSSLFLRKRIYFWSPGAMATRWSWNFASSTWLFSITQPQPETWLEAERVGEILWVLPLFSSSSSHWYPLMEEDHMDPWEVSYSLCYTEWFCGKVQEWIWGKVGLKPAKAPTFQPRTSH